MSATVNMRELQRNIKRLQDALPKKIARKALAEVGKLGVKKVKGSIPGRYRGVRKAIKWRQMKLKFNRGQPSIKIGAGVGKARKGDATTQKNDRSNRPGVGFGPQNIHWWFLGTRKRTTGTKRKRAGRQKKLFGGTKTRYIRVSTGNPKRNRGRMPAQERPIMVILASASGEIRSIIRRYVSMGIKQELR
jgi:hypothetical protein